MAEEQKFPYVVSYGLSRMFRVRHMDIQSYHIEQKVTRATADTPAEWKLLAISNHFDATEALGVMHEAQMSYAVELRARQNMARSMANGPHD